MLLLNKKTGNTQDFSSPIAELLLKKGTHVAVNAGETASLEAGELRPINEVTEHIKAIKEGACCKDGGECNKEEKDEVVEITEPETIEIITPDKSKPETKEKGKAGRPSTKK